MTGPDSVNPTNRYNFTKSRSAPTVTFYYDPEGEPYRVKSRDIDAALNQAAGVWSAGCNVNLVYGGIAKKGKHVVRWSGELGTPRRDGSRILGRAAPGRNVTLSSRDAEEVDLARILVHELGHVLGIGHLPNDPSSIMYPYMAGQGARLSDNDKLSCNLAMKANYGVDFEMPPKTRELTAAEMGLSR